MVFSNPSLSQPMAPKLTHFLFIFFSNYLLFHKIISAQQQTSNEKQILLNIKNDWGNPLSLTSWNLTTHHCEFAGIHCSGSDHGFVHSIKLVNINISFPIPASICDLKGLTFLELFHNNIPGEFPTVLYNCSKLQYLHISWNNFVGELPADIYNMPSNLTYLDISKNNFFGEFPTVLYNCSKLQYLDISWNNFVGELPADIYNMPSNLTYLDISWNNFTGDIPPAVGLLPTIKFFELSFNMFNGTIPAEMGNLSTLKSLMLAHNPFSPANILPEFGNLTSLTELWMSHMNLLGEIPKSFGNLANLELLKLGGHSLVWLIEDLDFYDNKLYPNNLTGSIPEAFGELKNLQELDLSGNQISGEIPVEIMSLTYLSDLDLSDNLLSGQIPDVIGFTNLSSLDLSNNFLSGNIPSNLGLLNFTSLSLSFNNLTGEIPLPLQTQAYKQSFVGNPNLCASNSFSSIQICKKLSTRLHILFYILGTLIFSVVFLLCFFITKERRRPKKAGAFPSDWKLTTFQVINFNESDISSSLTDDNLIGSGGGGTVYRVSFNPDNTVAVKKIHNTARLHFILEKQFEAEVNILGSIRHDNIVKLLCCISGENSKLLVYEYLENSSLDRWLHRRRRGNVAPLDWPTRLQIAVGAAKGLCYMHHHCFSPIIHRDVKSSNILLDSQFNAKIANFGLARILHKGGDPESVSAMAGSFGYMAPECSSLKKVNEKVDVYSFGVVLFELVTGKEARDGGEEEYENLTDWAWRRYKDRGAVVDEEIAGESSDQWVKEAEMMFKIGIICTVCIPAERPTMKEVVQMLMTLGCRSDGNDDEGDDNDSSGRDVVVEVQVVNIMEDSDDNVAT